MYFFRFVFFSLIFFVLIHDIFNGFAVQRFVSKKEQMEKKKRANVRANDVAMKEKEKHTEMLLIKQCLSPFFFSCHKTCFFIFRSSISSLLREIKSIELFRSLLRLMHSPRHSLFAVCI